MENGKAWVALPYRVAGDVDDAVYLAAPQEVVLQARGGGNFEGARFFGTRAEALTWYAADAEISAENAMEAAAVAEDEAAREGAVAGEAARG